MRGIRADIYRNGRGCFANGGLSDDPAIREVTIIDDAIDGPFEPTPEAPACRIVRREMFGKTVIHVEPIDQPTGKLGPMMGGCYVATSDSRFSRATGIYGAVALHDRFETQAEYDSLSR